MYYDNFYKSGSGSADGAILSSLMQEPDVLAAVPFELKGDKYWVNDELYIKSTQVGNVNDNYVNFSVSASYTGYWYYSAYKDFLHISHLYDGSSVNYFWDVFFTKIGDEWAIIVFVGDSTDNAKIILKDQIIKITDYISYPPTATNDTKYYSISQITLPLSEYENMAFKDIYKINSYTGFNPYNTLIRTEKDVFRVRQLTAKNTSVLTPCLAVRVTDVK